MISKHHAALLCLLIASSHLMAAAKEKLDFNRDIRPILSDKCYTCHGPDSNRRKAGLRLDRNEEPFKKLESGKTAIVPGKPEQSELVRRITTADADDKMPPSDARQLTKAEANLLVRWIKEGAQWERHWAYIPPKRPEIPHVRRGGWVRNAIDDFILARLQKEDLAPSREADKEQLIRRVTLDLTGLPPTPAEVDAFLADKSKDAYEKLVDRLLDSPAFGERMAQVWLDLARFADTNGYHIDNHRDIWLWRDWVINAFNKNMPFDQFTIEQLAGDMLPNATVEQKIASGFNRNNMVNFEGGADPNEYATKYVVDRVNTTSAVWLGTTMNCTECHDHKYDPFTQKEFYQLYALFNNVPELGIDGRTASPVPTMKVPSAEQSASQIRLEKEIAGLEKTLKTKLEEPSAKEDAAQIKWESGLRSNLLSGWSVVAAGNIKVKANGGITNLGDNSFLITSNHAEKETYDVVLKTTLTNITGVKIEALAQDHPSAKQIGRPLTGRFITTDFNLSAENQNPKMADTNDPPHLGAWYAFGPIRFGSVRQSYSRALIKETAPKVDLKETYEEGNLHWIKRPDWKDGEVHALEGGDYAAYYLHRKITVNKGRQLRVSLGSDDGIQVWLNGKKVFAHDTTRGAETERDVIILWLESGENDLLMKINNGSGGIAYFFKADEKVPDSFEVQLAGTLEHEAKSAWTNVSPNSREAILIGGQPFGFASGTKLNLRFGFDSERKQNTAVRFRVWVSTSDPLGDVGDLPVAIQPLLLREPAKRTSAQTVEMRTYFRSTRLPEVEKIERVLNTRKDELAKLEKEIPITMVMQEMEKPRDTFVLIRGDFQHRGEKVNAAVPKVLFSGSANQMPTNRLQFAQWLVAPENPLVARVTVNRFWQIFFGTGLVKTANDFGSQGEWPSHPELLDWLATEFMSSQWDMKHMIRLMVTSSTYRQTSEASPKAIERDRYNRLLARGPRFRMAAEMIRDNALAVSGLLTRKVGGESVRPYQPPGLWEAVAFGAGFTSQSYVQSHGSDLYRRGIYIYYKRSLPYPSLVTFDAPSREVCTVSRSRTTTPLQALVLMDDPVYVEAARALGQRILQEGGKNMSDRLTYAFRVTLSRKPSPKERQLLETIYQEQLENFKKDKDAALKLVRVGESSYAKNLDVSELAAWTAIGNVLLNLDETITKS